MCAMFGWLSEASTLRLALEPREPIGVGGEVLGQQLERDLAAQLRVRGAVDLAHAAGAEGRGIS